MKNQIADIEDHLETALFYDTELINKKLKTIRKLLHEVTQFNRTLLVSEG